MKLKSSFPDCFRFEVIYRALRKKVGQYRIIFSKSGIRGTVEISAILVRSKDTCR